MVDYWKLVPGIDKEQATIRASRALLEGQGKTYLTREVIKQLIKSGKWEVDYGDANGKSGSALTLRSHTGKKRNVIIESSSFDSAYLQRSLEMLADDFKRGEKEEKAIVPILKHLASRLNQSYPDGDVTRDDVLDLLKEPAARSSLKKSGMSSADVIDMVFDI